MKKKILIPLSLLVLFTGYPFIKLYASRSETDNSVEPPVHLQENKPHTNKAPDRSPSEMIDASDRNNSAPSQENHSVTRHDSVAVLVNKTQALSAEYEPPDLAAPDIPFSFDEDLPKKKMRAEAAGALEKLFAQAKREDLYLVGVSAYRSYQRQADIFNYNVKTKGEAQARQVSAQPGESEHQTGLAIDVSAPSVNYQLCEKFSDTTEGQWLKANAHKYGFIIRYPKNKEKITGYQYEPWHLRYVGKKAALEIAKNHSTLEEYTSDLK